MSLSYAAIAIVVLAVVLVFKTATVVPQQSAFVVEHLGKYSRTLSAGFHILIPFMERIAYRHSLKEIAIDIAEQICITRDNVQVGVDGVLYMQVMDPHLASYGITNYGFAISQLAQTTLRSEIGKIELDRTFEARGQINANVVSELDKASAPWGVKVLRYEIKNITPPKDVLSAMEKQMRAEREKRAVVLTSEGERDAKITEHLELFALLLELLHLQFDTLAGGRDVSDAAPDLLQQLELLLVGVVQGLPGIFHPVQGPVGLGLEDQRDPFHHAHKRDHPLILYTVAARPGGTAKFACCDGQRRLPAGASLQPTTVSKERHPGMPHRGPLEARSRA